MARQVRSYFLAAYMLVLSGGLIGQEVYTYDAAQSHFGAWEFDGVASWDTSSEVLTILKNQIITEPVRRPGAIAIFAAYDFKDVVIEATLQCGAPQDNMRGDMIVVFGYKSPTSFFYVHLTGTVDSIHNGVFRVDNADRTRIGDPIYPPLLPDRAWYDLRLECTWEKGEISLFIDDHETPSFKMSELQFPTGKVGLGSFNDPGAFKNIKIEGVPVQN